MRHSGLLGAIVFLFMIIYLYMYCGYSRERQEDIHDALTAQVIN